MRYTVFNDADDFLRRRIYESITVGPDETDRVFDGSRRLKVYASPRPGGGEEEGRRVNGQYTPRGRRKSYFFYIFSMSPPLKHFYRLF